MASREEEKMIRTSHIILAIFCVSLIGGYIYYVKHPEIVWGDEAAKYPERIVDLTETTDAEFQKILDNIQITTEESAAFNNNEIKPGYDKYGNKYTFSDNGMGAPIEIPKKAISVVNPNTGTKWAYSSAGWNISTRAERQAEIDKQQNRVVGKESNWTDEEVKQFINNMTINMGSMK